MPVFHVELRHLESKWRLWTGTILADTADEAVAEAKKFVAYAEQIPFQVAVTQVAEVAEKAAEVAGAVAPVTEPVDKVVEKVAEEVEPVEAAPADAPVKEDPSAGIKALLAELLAKL